jgi:magnesium transporter
VTITARLFDGRGDDREVQLTREEVRRLDDRRLLWVDLDERAPDDLLAVAQALDVDVTRLTEQGDKSTGVGLVRTADHIFLGLDGIEPESDPLEQRRLDVVIGHNVVVTMHDGPIGAIDAFDDEFHGDTRLGELDAGTFMAALADAVLTSYLREVEAIERQIDALDESALREPADDRFIRRLVKLRRRIALVRRALVPNREVLAPLARPEFELHQGLGKAWPGIAERLERTIAAVENARELLVGSYDIYVARAAHRSNEVMKVLTLISAVLLPAVVLAGIMGMNFDLAIFDDPNTFLFVIAAMIGLAIVILGVARWRRWI